MALKPAIPQPSSDPVKVLTALKENIEVITGRRGGAIALMNTNQLTGQNLLFAQKINEIITRLQD